MQIDVFHIIDRTQTNPAEVSHAGQFQLGSAIPTDESILLQVGWSLYCLDARNQVAVFVELPPDIDLAAASFVYGAQFQNARRVALVPFDALPALAAQIDAPRNLALLMSTGRCGSTLASRIFAHVPGVWSLSEPDWYTNLAFDRALIAPEQCDMLIAACTRLTCRPLQPEATQSIIIKPRSEMMVQSAAYVATLTEARAVFMYRDCFGYANSLYRFAQRVLGRKDPPRGSGEWEVIRQLSTINAPAALLDDFFNDTDEIGALELITLGWTLRMKAYLEAQGSGMRVMPIHYDDLNKDRREQTSLLLESCGIDQIHLDQAMRGFEKDAHAGTSGENSVQATAMTTQQRDRVGALVARWGLSDYQSDRLAPL